MKPDPLRSRYDSRAPNTVTDSCRQVARPNNVDHSVIVACDLFKKAVEVTDPKGSTMEKRCVLALDIDGVLVHPHDRLGGGTWDSRITEDLGIDPGALGQKLFRTHWSEIIVGKRDLKETLATVLPELNPSVSVDEFLEYWFANDARLDDGVAAELTKWRQRPDALCIAATNQEKRRVAYLRETVGLGTLFDHFFWSADLGVTKSSVEFYRGAVDKLGCEPHCVWFFDDDERNVAVSAEAGWNAFHFVGLESMREQLTAACPTA